MKTQVESTRSVIRLLRLALHLADQHQDFHLAAKISESLDCAEQRLEALEKA